jgi:hypothetical protein
MSQHIYGSAFMGVTAQSRSSADRIVKLILPVLGPKSVVDFGCSLGTWLAAWARAGATEIHGVDGAYLKGREIEIDPECMTFADLARPIDLGRRFDLVQSLEVAEHLPPDSSRTFVETLTQHGDRIMFSAAPPGQGGENHTNERPYAFWRDLFAERGYAMYDCVRPKIAADRAIRYWYRYNTFLFVRSSLRSHLPVEILKTRVDDAGLVSDISPMFFKMRKSVVRRMPLSTQNLIAGTIAKLRGAG